MTLMQPLLNSFNPVIIGRDGAAQINQLLSRAGYTEIQELECKEEKEKRELLHPVYTILLDQIRTELSGLCSSWLGLNIKESDAADVHRRQKVLCNSLLAVLHQLRDPVIRTKLNALHPRTRVDLVESIRWARLASHNMSGNRLGPTTLKSLLRAATLIKTAKEQHSAATSRNSSP